MPQQFLSGTQLQGFALELAVTIALELTVCGSDSELKSNANSETASDFRGVSVFACVRVCVRACVLVCARACI